MLFLSTFLVITLELGFVLSQTAHVTLPGFMKTLSGSCVQIPCVFDVSEFAQNDSKRFAVWVKGSSNLQSSDAVVVFNGTGNVTTLLSRVEIVGNLTECNCTTVFYNMTNNLSGQYFFRLETRPDVFKYMFSNNPISISVSGIPNPLVNFSSGLKEVMDGSAVNISCSAYDPCPSNPPTISWSNISNSITTWTQQNRDQTQTVVSEMTFTASYVDDGTNISCTVTYPRQTSSDSTVEETMMLRVLYPPKETHVIVQPSASVSPGANVSLTCNSKANPDQLNYTWYKQGQSSEFAEGMSLLFLNINVTDAGQFSCQAQNKFGVQMSDKVQLTVNDSSEASVSRTISCVVGVFAFLFFTLLGFFFIRLRTGKSCGSSKNHSDQGIERNLKINSIYMNSAYMKTEEPEMPKNENEIIHYGEIEFTKQIQSGQAEKPGTEIMYAEISISK